MKSLLLFLSSLFLTTLPALSQDGEQGYRAPLDLPLRLSGNFGELRSNHFHTGIDLKTRGKTGYEVKAIAEGHVSRIKVQEGGYGNALYIDHPDGNTSVYAHLKHFAPKVERFLRKVQYQRERNTIDLYPGKGKLPVKKGETVAISGNSGRSGAPHLHFEIRNTESEKPIDPLKFDFGIQDQRPPVFKGLRVIQSVNPTAPKSYSAGETYELSKIERDLSRIEPDSSRIERGHYGLEGAEGYYGTLYADRYATLGFAVRVIDRASGTRNPLGVHRLKVSVKGRTLLSVRFDTLDFSKMPFVNAHIDHPYLYEEGHYYHRLHLLPYNELAIYERGEANKAIGSDGDGWFPVRDWPSTGTSYSVSIEASDRAGNRSHLSFTVKMKEGAGPMDSIDREKDDIRVFERVRQRFRKEGIELRFPPRASYHSLHLHYERDSVRAPQALSEGHQIHTPATPLHKSFTARIKLDTLPPGMEEKLFIVSEDEKWSDPANKASYDSGWAVADVGRLGKLSVRADSTAPEIQTLRTADRIPAEGSASFHFRIEDEGIGLADYEARIGGHWRICRLDVKSGTLRVKMSDPLAPLPEGEHEFVLKVRDRVGNTELFKKHVEVE